MHNLKGLLQGVQSEGGIENSTANILTSADTLAQIRKGMGISPDQYTESDVLIITILMDDSGSMASNAQNAIDGHNEVIAALKGSKKGGRTIVSCRYINGKVVYPYCKLADALCLDSYNYIPDGATPLYDQTMITLGGALATSKEYEDAGISVQTWTLIVTDGCDYGSVKASASDVSTLISSMNNEAHIVLAMGIDDRKTNFREVFKSMGILEKNILVGKKDPKEIRAMFRMASQSATAFNSPVGGGFTA